MTPQEQYEHLVETVKGYNPAAGFDQIRAAYEFADTHHAGQNRKDGSPFITHPLAVAQIVAEELHLDTESIVAALLPDTLAPVLPPPSDTLFRGYCILQVSFTCIIRQKLRRYHTGINTCLF